MPYYRIARFLIILFSLTFSACSQSYAATIEPAKQNDAPQCHVSKRCMTHLRDSIFHSYMDSLDYRIHALNDVAHKVDSLSRILNSKGHVNLHLDGKTLGPLRIPEFSIPEIRIPEWKVDVPKITIPEIDVPQIQMPDIDIQSDGWLSSNERAGDSPDDNVILSGTVSECNKRGLITFSKPSYSEQYYSNGMQRFYIGNPLWAQVKPPAQNAKALLIVK